MPSPNHIIHRGHQNDTAKEQDAPIHRSRRRRCSPRKQGKDKDGDKPAESCDIDEETHVPETPRPRRQRFTAQTLQR